MGQAIGQVVGRMTDGRAAIDAAKVAAVVGTVLNIVNHGQALLAASGIEWWRVGLNYAVPFCVASYSAARVRMRQESSSCD